MRFGWETYRRVLQEGFDAYKLAGPFAHCPYGADERNGIWVFGEAEVETGIELQSDLQSIQADGKTGLMPAIAP